MKTLKLGALSLSYKEEEQGYGMMNPEVVDIMVDWTDTEHPNYGKSGIILTGKEVKELKDFFKRTDS